MARALLLMFLLVQPVLAGLARYPDLVVSDPPNQTLRAASVQVTYLGTNGYQLETAGHSILIDPYFSRISLARAAFGWPVRPQPNRIGDAMAHLNGSVDAILVTHGHFDHLLDAPPLMQRTGARLIASPTAVELAKRAGANASQCVVVSPGAVRTIGPFRIAALPASHDRLLMMGVPFDQPLKPGGPPVRASDWVCGEPLSYLITVAGLKIFVDSGGTPAVLPAPNLGPVDLAILGMALPDSRARFTATVARLQPRYILPSHQDNFFLPLARGFSFAPLTDFEFVRREHQKQHMRGRLILLDYFRRWTLPRR